jgi:mannose-1-phosphate guanylyltransferase/mannose-6-phosphate isomerase
LEPVARNTAPAISVVAWDIVASEPDGIMLVLPSDHVILDVPSFHTAIQDAVALARQNYLATFGVVPTAPKTGYGYIKKGEIIGTDNQFQIAAFVEKPDRNTANKYLESQSYFWNSGIFVFKANVFLEELKRYAPDIYEFSLKTHQNIQQDTDFAWINQADFEHCSSTSIDYAIMEKTERAAVIAVDMGWSDVGTWGALWEVVSKDASGNATNGHVYLKDVSNCYIKSKKEIVAALGIDDLIVIDTDDALLIAHMDKEQEVRDVFKKLM